MTRIKLPYVHEFADRHGKIRRYVRLPGRKRVTLKGIPGTEEFMAAYQEAIAGLGRPKEKREVDIGPGTIDAAIASYLASSVFSQKSPNTQAQRRRVLKNFAQEHGRRRISHLNAGVVEKLLAAQIREHGPFAARDFFYTIRVLMKHAITVKLIASDPTYGIELPRLKTDGFKTWNEEAIAKFEAYHPVGSMARLAFALMLYTIQRRSDIVALGWRHVQGNRIFVKPNKTKNSTGKVLGIPIHPELAEILNLVPRERATFIITPNGTPYLATSFTKWFNAQCAAAKIPSGLSPHGLRKAGLRRLAEAGAPAPVMQALSGHASLKELETYIREADQLRMAEQAVNLWVTSFPRR